jgi:phosphatidylserine/phosphatidylglycerophosphate/cardiolipin synthase-like enzyme
MASFLTTIGTSDRIEHIIMSAKKELYLVSPFLQISKTLFERLKDAANRRVNISLVYGKDELKPNERNSLAEIKNLNLYYFENLHAKCYFNESQMVITSMNMYEFSEKNNREMGVFIDASNDHDLYVQAKNETSSIIGSSEVISLTKTKRQYAKMNHKAEKTNGKAKPKRGYCIRCEERIPYNIERPYCSSCFSTWAQYKDPTYEEDFCHACGEFKETSMEKPLCFDCFKQFQKLPYSH